MMLELPVQSMNDSLDVAGARIAYEAIGTGHPLVLVHAGIADARMWDDQMEAFAEHYRVIRYDLRGFGRSSPASGTFSHRDDLVALLNALNIERAHLVGLSRGGRLVVDFALEYPERVSAIVAGATWPSGQEPSLALIKAFSAVDDALAAGDLDGAVEHELRIWVDGPYRQPGDVSPSIRELVREMNTPLLAAPDDWQEVALDPPSLARFHEITAPALVIVGNRDQPDILAGAHLIATGISGARKVVIPNTAHMLNMEQPAAFNRAVLAFLAEVDVW